MTTKPKAKKFRIRRSEGAESAPEGPRVVRRQVPLRMATPEENAAAAAAPSPSASPTPAPGQVAGETDLDAIRREGLTSRQLRMARRIAARHGIAPASDLDAVRQLRLAGIDPFQRSDALAVVGAPEARGAPSANLPVPRPQTLPQPAPAPGPPAAAPTAAPAGYSAGEREAAIGRMQRDIARRRRRRSLLLLARLMFFVFLPTALAGYYFYAVATPLYATKSEFVIQQADAAAGGGLGGLFSGTGMATSQDSIGVQGYLESLDAMLRLDADEGFRAHFSQDFIDPLNRVEPGATDADLFKLYRRVVKIGYDPTEGVIRMEVIAAAPEAAERFARALIGYAEDRVDNLTLRLREDQMSGAEASFEEAEAAMRDAQAEVIRLKELSGVVDGASVVAARLGQINTFETELMSKRLQLQSLQANARPNQARVEGLQGDIGRLETLIAQMNAALTESERDSESLARVSSELLVAETDLQTRQMMMSQSLQQLETARIEANRQTRYLSTNVRPVAPDDAAYPRAFENTALAFVIFGGIYLMLSLTASILREQVSS